MYRYYLLMLSFLACNMCSSLMKEMILVFSFKAHEYMLYVAQEGMHASQFMYVLCSMCVSMRIYM